VFAEEILSPFRTVSARMIVEEQQFPPIHCRFRRRARRCHFEFTPSLMVSSDCRDDGRQPGWPNVRVARQPVSTKKAGRRTFLNLEFPAQHISPAHPLLEPLRFFCFFFGTLGPRPAQWGAADSLYLS